MKRDDKPVERFIEGSETMTMKNLAPEPLQVLPPSP